MIDLSAFRTAAHDAAQRLHDMEKTIRVQHRALVRERKNIYDAPRALDELLADMRTCVDVASATWVERNAPEIIRNLSGREEWRGSGDSRRSVTVKPSLPMLNSHDGGRRLTFFDEAGLDPERLKARFETIIRQSGAFGLPKAARAARLAELDQHITDREAEHEVVIGAAAELGISFPMLESVQRRREEDERRRAKELQREQDRAKGIFPVGA